MRRKCVKDLVWALAIFSAAFCLFFLGANDIHAAGSTDATNLVNNLESNFSGYHATYPGTGLSASTPSIQPDASDVITATAANCPAVVQQVVFIANSLVAQINSFEQSASASVAASLAAPTRAIVQAVNSLVAGCNGEATNNGNQTTTDSSGLAFPLTIFVTASSLNVRSLPSVTAALAGTQTLYAGNTFTATNEVTGDTVDGNDLWWVSSLGNYVWSGGTEVSEARSSIAVNAHHALSAHALAVMATTATITDSHGNQYPVTYSYLPDGEITANFSFTYPNANSYSQNLKNDFPIAAQGTHQYIYQGNVEGIVNADDSVSILNSGNDCSNFMGTAGCIESDPDFTSLIASIKTNAPASEFPSGLTFSTPPGTAAGTYLLSGLYPVNLVTDVNGDTIAALSVNQSGYGSGIAWYDFSNGYYTINTPGYFSIQGGSIPSGYVVLLQNVIPDNTSNPSQITANVAIATTAQIADGQTSQLTGLPITLTLEASVNTIVSAQGLQIIPISNSPTSAIAGIVTYDGALQAVVNAGGVAAYQYVIANNLTSAAVVALANGIYQVTPATGAAVAFDQNGKELGSTVTITGPSAPTITSDELYTAMAQATGFNAELKVASDAGYIVEVNETSSDPYDMTAVIRDPQTNAFVAALSQSND